MKLSLSLLLALILLGLSPVSPAQVTDKPVSEKDEANFKELYREKLSTVNRTRGTDDDLALAKEMMAFAHAIPDDPGVQCLIYIEVIPLAASGSDIQMMSEAVALLDKRWPGHEATSIENQLDLAARAFRAVSRSSSDRLPVGEAYIDLLMGMVKQCSERNELQEAIDIGRLANTIARSIESDQRERISLMLEQLATESVLADRIKMLELSVKKNPQNKPAARELVELLLKKRNDPAAASAYVQSTGDEELISLVNHAAKGNDQANAAIAMRIGDWYLTLAEDEGVEQAMSLLNESRKWYERFFDLYPRDDALARRVADMDNLALLKIERLIEDNPELIGKNKDGFEPLIAPPFDAQAHKLGEAVLFEVNEGQVAIEEGSLLVPFKKVKTHEIRLTVTVNKDASESRPAITLHLPVGENRLLTTRYFVDHFHIAQIDVVTETRLIEPAPGKVGQKHQLTFQVAETEGTLAFAMLYNGRAGVKWQGNLEELEAIPDETLALIPEGMGPVMLLRCDANVTLHAVDYKAHD